MLRILLPVAGLLLISCSPRGAQCSLSSCTDSSGNCQPGTTVDACGGEAKLCVQCTGSDRCSATTRTCAPCGSTNCSGCCSSDGRCVVEVRDRDLNCGFNGAACVDCTATGKTCSTTALGCQ